MRFKVTIEVFADSIQKVENAVEFSTALEALREAGLEVDEYRVEDITKPADRPERGRSCLICGGPNPHRCRCEWGEV